MLLFDLQERLKANGVTATVRVNDNIRTYVSVSLSQKNNPLRLSLHRSFLSAPEEVLDALISFVRGDKPAAKVVLNKFVSRIKETVDYSSRLDVGDLESKGNLYDLKQIFDSLNAEYFQNSLQLSVTYFGEEKRKRTRNAILGSYCDVRRLIRIHRMLDDERVPRFVIEYVMYHEMLHSIFPTEYDSRGMRRIHHKAFRERERTYCKFQLARMWIRQNLKNL